MADHLKITLSVPTSGGGVTPAATFFFFTSGYSPPREGRSLGEDTVHNQNGVFRYRYDNGPNFREWGSFDIVCADEFTNVCGGGATQQQANLEFLWQYIGKMGLADPFGSYSVGWATDFGLQPRISGKIANVGDKLELRYEIELEEA
jgi:hypothetical protein